MGKTIITQDELDELHYAVYDIDSGADIYHDYSGRGMYGSKCIGIVTHDTNGLMLRLSRHLTSALADKIEAAQVCYDNMGLQDIVYWPSLMAEEPPAERKVTVKGQVTVVFEVELDTKMDEDDIQELVVTQVYNAVSASEENVPEGEDLAVSKWFVEVSGEVESPE